VKSVLDSHPSDATRARSKQRSVIMLLLCAWGVAAYMIGGWVARDMRFRINDLSSIPGAGYIMRDPDGVFYHVNTAGRARAVFPKLESPGYAEECLDCTLVTGEQLSQTNQFCASSTRQELPHVRFEIPCETWGPIGEGQKIAGFLVFVTPLLLYWIFNRALRAFTQKKSNRPFL